LAGFELVTVGEALLLLSQPFDSARLMLLCCRLDLGFHFSGFLRETPNTHLRAILAASALHDRGSANISKLPGVLKPREEKDPGAG
jgi:hypothetical protein